MTPAGSVIVVDANIVVSAALGRRTRAALAIIGRKRRIMSSIDSAHEVVSVVRRLRPGRERARDDALNLLRAIDVAPRERYADRLADAEAALRNAVASRNGSTSDAHVLALAWVLDADIWSHDRDFAGTGWPSWSSANLLAQLGGDTAASGA